MTSPEPPTPTPPESQDDDDLHRRFREALDRKRNRGTAPDSGTGDDSGSKSHGTTGPAKHQRTFRRKSG
jgi:Family of unknown function (DUF5302)